MASLKKRFFTLAVTSVLSLNPASAQQSSPAAPVPAKPAQRTMAQVITDLNAAASQLRAAGNPEAVFDEKARAEIAPKLIPPMKRMVALFEELMIVSPNMRQQVAEERWRFIAILSLLGDADATAGLTNTAASPGPDQKQARLMQTMVRWWQAGKNATAQFKVVEEIAATAKAEPADEAIVGVLSSFSAQAVDDTVQTAVEKIVANDLTSPAGKSLAKDLQKDRTLRGMENQPLAFEAKKLDGSTFNTSDWKGKVILVDVWATWCAPCVAELPKVVKVYQQYHDKGLEIVALSCDDDPKKLSAFLAEHKDMPWPQLFNPAKPGWHPLAEQWGIRRIPTMLLIDKKGVVRSVDAVGKYEEMIPKLLGE